MTDIDAYFKTKPEAERASEQIEVAFPVEVSPPAQVEPRNSRAWEITISPVGSGSAADSRFFNAVLSIVNRFDGEVHEAPASGSRFVNQLPQSVIDRYRDEHPQD